MNKYRVFVEGKNFIVKIENKIDRYGFFTTRFIEAKHAQDAEKISLDLIRDELKDVVLNEKPDPPMLYINEIDELESFGDHLVPGKGFTWFEEKGPPEGA